MGSKATLAAAVSSMTWMSSTKGKIGLTTLVVKPISGLFLRNRQLSFHWAVSSARVRPSVGADRLQRARDDPFRLVPPRRREGVFLCIPFRMTVPVTHDLIHQATVRARGLPGPPLAGALPTAPASCMACSELLRAAAGPETPKIGRPPDAGSPAGVGRSELLRINELTSEAR